jgi:hypothetical protein
VTGIAKPTIVDARRLFRSRIYVEIFRADRFRAIGPWRGRRRGPGGAGGARDDHGIRCVRRQRVSLPQLAARAPALLRPIAAA